MNKTNSKKEINNVDAIFSLVEDELKDRNNRIYKVAETPYDYILCDEDNKLIELRYFKHMTQKETGKTLNMTQVQVSRKEKRILHNIRSKMLC